MSKTSEARRKAQLDTQAARMRVAKANKHGKTPSAIDHAKANPLPVGMTNDIEKGQKR